MRLKVINAISQFLFGQNLASFMRPFQTGHAFGTGLEILAGTALAIAAAGTGYQISSAEDAKDRQSKQLAEQKKNASALMTQQKQQADQMTADQAAEEASAQSEVLRGNARARQKALALGASGRSDTILTGPLGLTGQPQGAGKTLLGL